MTTLSEIQAAVHALAVEKGWYDGVVVNNDFLLARLMLMVSELAEACEEVRKPDFDPCKVYYAGSRKPEGYGIELADCVIRIMDTCGKLGIDLEEMIDIKHTYNKTRPYKHGKTA